MTSILLLGRILFGGYFIYNGVSHLTETAGMSGYAKSKNVPFATFSVIFSGLLLLFGGLGVLLWLLVKPALIAIIVFLLAVSFKMHNFWSDTDQNAKMGNKINFSKNIALIGAALILLSI